MGLQNTAAMLALVVLASACLANAQEPREMKSHAEYEKDLVKDEKPSEPHAFDYPYPAPQEDSSFDKDFTKDDNSDMGEWAAQMEYDRLRSMIKRAEKNLPNLKERRDRAEEKYQDYVAEAEKVDKEVKMEELDIPEAMPPAEIEAEEEEFEAIEQEKDAEEVIQEEVVEVPEEVEMEEVPKPELPPAPEKPKIDISSKELDDAVANLKECEAKVVAAKEKLMTLIEERQNLKKELEAADASNTTAAEGSEAAKQQVEKKEADVKEANEELQKADAKYQKEVADVEKLKAAVDSSAYKIKQVRGQAADGEGAVVEGGASRFASFFSVSVIAGVSLMM